MVEELACGEMHKLGWEIVYGVIEVFADGEMREGCREIMKRLIDACANGEMCEEGRESVEAVEWMVVCVLYGEMRDAGWKVVKSGDFRLFGGKDLDVENPTNNLIYQWGDYHS